jgi:hypothetical protein
LDWTSRPASETVIMRPSHRMSVNYLSGATIPQLFK